MLKRTSAAFFVWGAILAISGIATIGNGYYAGVLSLILGLGLFGGGIGRAIYCKNYNNNLIAREGYEMTGVCHNCNYQIDTNRGMFRVHKRNFPEGYIFCPSCKKPLSIRAFSGVIR